MLEKAQPVIALVFGLAGAVLLVSLCGLSISICKKLRKTYPRQCPTILRILALIAFILGFTWLRSSCPAPPALLSSLGD